MPPLFQNYNHVKIKTTFTLVYIAYALNSRVRFYLLDVVVEFFNPTPVLFHLVMFLFDPSLHLIFAPHLVVQTIFVHFLLALQRVKLLHQCRRPGACFFLQTMILLHLSVDSGEIYNVAQTMGG